MCIDTGISCSPSEVFVFSIWYMLMRSSISVLLSQTKVDNVDKIPFLAKTHQKIVWLHITMDKIFTVDIFYSAYL